jgi:hypothetical protein
VIAELVMELTDSTLVAPGLSLGAFAGLIALAAREYKAARQIDVEGERRRRQDAEAREQQSGTSNSTKLDALAERVRSLESKIDQMRAEHETALLDERGKNFALRKLLRENGVPIPDELGPK